MILDTVRFETIFNFPFCFIHMESEIKNLALHRE